ncbi:MAG: NADP-dependent phosphogluconate dehydrogenase [Paracoccaceae bacterium]|nr:NADP-dependent phosphogluconate dehydrogenase [Paracoccaceae bacterium]
MADIGLTGLGTMGAALALNIAEKGFSVAVHNRSRERTDALVEGAGDLAANLTPLDDLAEFATALTAPRLIVMMVPAGAAVDAVIEALLPRLDEGDTLIDAGNADFNDTRRREAALAQKGFGFVGMGVSGGEDGARHGPSIMVGGPEASYERLGPIVEAIAARYQGAPCAAWLGPDGAGHFVKTVHNGIEYADMQMIAEVWGLLRAAGRAPKAAAELFAEWDEGPLRSYLIEITAKVLAAADTETGEPLIDVILDVAGQKGTGRWTVIEALKLGQSASAIEAAVGARSWSSEVAARRLGEDRLGAGEASPRAILDGDLEKALLAARIIGYSQGLTLLARASAEFDWSLDLARIAEIWRAGCIIRSALLDDIAHAARDGLAQNHLILAPYFADRLAETVPALRRVVASAICSGDPVPALAAALSFYDTMRRARGTADLIQGQRDYFGRHGFQRRDRDGEGFHGPWAD